MLRGSDLTWTGFVVLWVVWISGEMETRRVAEEAFVAAPLSDEECRTIADALRRIVVQVESLGEERRLELLDGAEPAPRRSGHRPKG